MKLSFVVFLVEDEYLMTQLLEDCLTDLGYTVKRSVSGEDAVVMLDKEGSGYSALITDINLSGHVTGWEVAKHARQINSTIPVIYMTAARADQWASIGVPNSVLVRKPYAFAQIEFAVAQLIRAASSG